MMKVLQYALREIQLFIQQQGIKPLSPPKSAGGHQNSFGQCRGLVSREPYMHTAVEEDAESLFHCAP